MAGSKKPNFAKYPFGGREEVFGFGIYPKIYNMASSKKPNVAKYSFGGREKVFGIVLASLRLPFCIFLGIFQKIPMAC